jgi:hypothetical protein
MVEYIYKPTYYRDYTNNYKKIQNIKENIKNTQLDQRRQEIKDNKV